MSNTPKARRRHSRPVDVAKMERLRDAGLHYRSIARECDCTVGYVSQRLSGWYDAQRKHAEATSTKPQRRASNERADRERATR